MTPQLQQAIKLLQMSNIELSDFVETEVEKNPLLKVEGDETGPAEGDATTAEDTDGAPTEADSRAEDHALSEETFDTGAENLYDDAPVDLPRSTHEVSGGTTPISKGAGLDQLMGLEERLAEKPNLREHLRAQLGQVRAAPMLTTIARYLIEELDDHGYLRTDLADIAERLEIAAETCEQALDVLQQCEPTGVGARDVAECLALQLRESDDLDAQMEILLANLDLLARGELRRLRVLCGATDAELAEMVHLLRGLDPRPCALFDTVEPETLIPDVLLRRTDWGGFQIELNPETLPRVLIDRTYVAEFGGSGCEQTRRFLSDCQSNASWLIKSLDQRAKTIVKIASEIVRKQEAFFSRGISGLRPLTLKDVAEAVGMHESTASRVTANKYIATERGIFELKFFFTNSVGGEGDFAAEAVRHRIKVMVDAEAPDAILSDDTIVSMLQAEGIDIARRTVAKYRKSLDIQSSVDRRRQKSVDMRRA